MSGDPTHPIFLSGPMGAGKSTVARALGARLGWPVVDLDERVASEAGQPVEALFQSRGEAAFRALEQAAVDSLLSSSSEPRVVSLGGGTVTDAATRAKLLRAGTLVTLDAPLDVLLTRVGAGEGRPLLASDPSARLKELLRERSSAYAECHARVDATAPPTEVAAAIAEFAAEIRVVVPLGERSYVVEIGTGARHRLPQRAAAYGLRVMVADENTHPYFVPLEDSVEVTLSAGEAHKDMRSVTKIWDAALAGGIGRDGIVIAVGGGVVGDLAGFAAATLLRGVAFAQVPTTLLAMVDASVGGKTGFNHASGKNLIGAFHQPSFVLCDPSVLVTLDDRERRSGLAEVVKSAWLAGEEDVLALERDAEALGRGEIEATTAAIERSVRLKARVVSADALERGERRNLNLGHTVGHALEAAAGYGALRHGEAVSLGLVAAMRVGTRLGHATSEHASRMTRLLQTFGLPVDLDRRLTEEVWAYLGADKKKSGIAEATTIGFIVPGAPGDVRIEPLAIDDIRSAVGSRSSSAPRGAA